MEFPGDDGRLPVTVDNLFFGFAQGSVHVHADSNRKAKLPMEPPL